MREPSGWCPALILLMAVTVGCVSRVPAPYLVKNVTEQQVAADDFECRKESTVGTESSFAFGHPIILLGWWIHVRNVTVRAENEATRLWGLCMKARGYHPEGGVGEVAISRQAPISETQKSFAAAADELHSILPTSPFCALPGYSAPDLTILRMSTHTSRQGFQLGDRVVSVDHSPVSATDEVNNELFKRRPGDQLKIGIERSGVPLQIEATCTDGLPIATHILGALDAGAEGDWVKCLMHVSRLQQLTAVSSAIAEMGVSCNDGSRISEGRVVSVADAAMVYEASRLAIEEAQVWPDGVGSAQTAALARVTWLKANGYTELAEDLKALANQ